MKIHQKESLVRHKYSAKVLTSEIFMYMPFQKVFLEYARGYHEKKLGQEPDFFQINCVPFAFLDVKLMGTLKIFVFEPNSLSCS